MKHQYPIVRVEWIDAAGVSQDTTIDELSAKNEGYPKITVGYLFTDTPKGIRVGLTHGKDEPKSVFEVLEILRPYIVSIEYLWPRKKMGGLKSEPKKETE